MDEPRPAGEQHRERGRDARARAAPGVVHVHDDDRTARCPKETAVHLCGTGRRTGIAVDREAGDP
jgi:hypothetical protein